MKRHLRAVPDQRASEPAETPKAPTQSTRTLNPADIVEAFQRLGLDPDSVQSLVVTRPGLVIHALHRIPGAVHVAERTTPDGTTIHTHRIPWTQEPRP